MLSVKGTDVTLHVKTKIGTDAFGVDAFSDSTVTVGNVVIAPSSDNEIVDTLNLYGKRSIYTLYIPKDDSHTWTDTDVEFFGTKWHTIGAVTEYMQHMLPSAWNKVIRVERCV